MALDNVKGILNIGSPLSSYKLLLMQGGCSRPKFAPLFRRLLQPFVKNGRISVQYRCHGRMLFCYVRTSELESDFYSIRELGVNDVYSLDLAFHPDLVIDGGGNIGMFTLRAAAGLQSAGDKSVKHVICEPVPGNVEQIRTHLRRGTRSGAGATRRAKRVGPSGDRARGASCRQRLSRPASANIHQRVCTPGSPALAARCPSGSCPTPRSARRSASRTTGSRSRAPGSASAATPSPGPTLPFSQRRPGDGARRWRSRRGRAGRSRARGELQPGLRDAQRRASGRSRARRPRGRSL